MKKCKICGKNRKGCEINHCRKCDMVWCDNCNPLPNDICANPENKCPFCWTDHFDAVPKQNLDYDNPDETVNFRDAGEWINLISGRFIMAERHVYRGGTIKAIRDPSAIGNPKTIFCLQKGPDPDLPGVKNFHFPVSNDYEKYHTSLPEVRDWVRKIVQTIEQGIDFPLYIHCLSGRDRTGVIVAALLRICSAGAAHIIEEYHLSIGTEKRNHIEITLAGFDHIDDYFKGINLPKIRALLRNNPERFQSAGQL